jgi:hypothetical protein
VTDPDELGVRSSERSPNVAKKLGAVLELGRRELSCAKTEKILPHFSTVRLSVPSSSFAYTSLAATVSKKSVIARVPSTSGTLQTVALVYAILYSWYHEIGLTLLVFAFERTARYSIRTVDKLLALVGCIWFTRSRTIS